MGALEYLTPVAVTIIAYTFFGLDALGDELEDPFGKDENDLPVALARVIEIDLLEGLGVRPLPDGGAGGLCAELGAGMPRICGDPQ